MFLDADDYELLNDFENDDYNNAYYNVTIIEDIQ